MDKQTREYLKREVDKKVRQRDRYNCDPENLTVRAAEADALGFTEVANALRKFRDSVVNPLLGEGWTLERIENAAYRHFTGEI